MISLASAVFSLLNEKGIYRGTILAQGPFFFFGKMMAHLWVVVIRVTMNKQGLGSQGG